ncbi:UNVERIFIED_CONTAM: hypothetical protein GTU68_006844 [Idotea baltica]|nr:hypothetical protein [Idotea baltica]
MQEAIEKAAKSKYGQELDIRAIIDTSTGEQSLWRIQTIVEDAAIEDETLEITLSDAKKIDATLEVGDEIKEELPPFDFGRVAAQTAKQVIMQKVRDAERERQFNEYKDRVGEVINGIVKRVEYGHVIVDIDIIPWNYDDATFIVNALQPAEVSKVVLDEDEHRVEVVVADDQFPLAIGRRGQNVRLASQLTGWQIDLVTESADSERYQREFQERTSLFMKALDADETLAQLLASEGFETVEEIAYVSAEDFIQIEGFDEDVANELQTRAREFLERQAAENDAARKELGVEDAVMELESMTPAFAVKLGNEGVKTVDDVAGLVPDDITGWREPGPDGKPVWVEGILKKGEMRKDDAQMFIMRARVVAGWVEPEALEQLQADLTEETAPDLTEEERALLALGDLGGVDAADVAAAEESAADDDIEFDLEALAAEGGDEEAAPEE